MIRSVLGVLLAAVLLFLWGFVFWVYSTIPAPIMKGLPNESVVVEALKAQNLEAGNYMAPFPTEMTDEGAAAFAKKHEEGPIVSIFYQPQGSPVMGPQTLGSGFAQMVVSCSLMAGLLWLVGGALPSFVARWTFVVLVGVFAAVNIHLAAPIWYNWTWLHGGILFVFDTVGWVLAAIPLAGLVKTRTL